MKRIFSLIGIILIVGILISDASMVIKYLKKPDSFMIMENISFIHWLLLHNLGYNFAILKLIFSTVMLVMWVCKFIYPTKAVTLAYVTSIYSFLWVFIGVLMLTGISGILQYSVNMPVELLNLSPLVTSIPIGKLIFLIASVILLPLLLLAVPKLHNRYV